MCPEAHVGGEALCVHMTAQTSAREVALPERQFQTHSTVWAFPGCWGVDGGSQVKAACAVRGREGLGSRTDLGYFPCDPG